MTIERVPFAQEARARKAASIPRSTSFKRDDGDHPKTSIAGLIAFALEQAETTSYQFALQLAVALLASPALERHAAERLIELCYRLQQEAC